MHFRLEFVLKKRHDMKKYTILFVLFLVGSAYSQTTKKVLIIGIDGCRPDALTLALTPNIDSLAANGLYSVDALNDDITISGPGWSSILCGVKSDKHLVTGNNFSGNNYANYPTLFTYIEQYDPNLHTVSICEWDPINDDIIQNAVDLKINTSPSSAIGSMAENYLSVNDPDVMFLHFDKVDHAGHAYGFSPNVPQYISAIQDVDLCIGGVVEAVKNRSSYSQEDWLFLVTTDHGGVGTSHGGTSLEHRQIFMIASGDNIPNSIVSKDSSYVTTYNCLADTASLVFDGNNSVAIADAPNLNFGTTQDFTVECRVRTNSGGDVSIVGNKDWDSGFNKGFVFSFSLPSNEWKVNIGDGTNREDLDAGLINDDQWHTLSASFNRDGYLKSYLDGLLIDSVNISTIGDINTNQGLFFGTDIDLDYGFSGAIQEVRLWNGVVEDQEIQDYSCNVVDSSHPNYADLIGYWRLEEGSGTSTVDYSSSLNNGVISGATWLVSDSVLVYDFTNTPRQMDVASTGFTHLCIPEDVNWDLDGNSLIGENCNSTGINIINNDQSALIYPNPTNGYFNIKSASKVILVLISDLNGRQLMSTKNADTIDVSGFNKGVYQVLVETEQGAVRTNLIKN